MPPACSLGVGRTAAPLAGCIRSHGSTADSLATWLNSALSSSTHALGGAHTPCGSGGTSFRIPLLRWLWNAEGRRGRERERKRKRDWAHVERSGGGATLVALREGGSRGGEE